MLGIPSDRNQDYHRLEVESEGQHDRLEHGQDTGQPDGVRKGKFDAAIAAGRVNESEKGIAAWFGCVLAGHGRFGLSSWEDFRQGRC